MKKTLVLVAMVLLMASTAMATTMADLVGGGITLQVDDKLFSNFFYSSASSGGGAAIPASGVTVISDSTAFNPGLEFQAPWQAFTGQTTDSQISFDVQVLQGGNAITDISATLVSYGVISTGSILFTENTTNPTGSLLLFANGTQVQSYDEFTFDPTTGVIHVSKDLGLNGGSDGVAGVSLLKNNFSEVPEPATMLLLGSGLIGMGVYARRKFKK